MLRGALARARAAHELENVNSFPWALQRDYLDAPLAYNHHVALDDVSYHLALGSLSLGVDHDALVHHHVLHAYPLAAVVDLSGIIRGAVKVVGHDHILGSRLEPSFLHRDRLGAGAVDKLEYVFEVLLGLASHHQPGVAWVLLFLAYRKLEDLKVALEVHDAVKYPRQYHGINEMSTYLDFLLELTVCQGI